MKLFSFLLVLYMIIASDWTICEASRRFGEPASSEIHIPSCGIPLLRRLLEAKDVDQANDMKGASKEVFQEEREEELSQGEEGLNQTDGQNALADQLDDKSLLDTDTDDEALQTKYKEFLAQEESDSKTPGEHAEQTKEHRSTSLRGKEQDNATSKRQTNGSLIKEDLQTSPESAVQKEEMLDARDDGEGETEPEPSREDDPNLEISEETRAEEDLPVSTNNTDGLGHKHDDKQEVLEGEHSSSDNAAIKKPSKQGEGNGGGNMSLREDMKEVDMNSGGLETFDQAMAGEENNQTKNGTTDPLQDKHVESRVREEADSSRVESLTEGAEAKIGGGKEDLVLGLEEEVGGSLQKNKTEQKPSSKSKTGTLKKAKPNKSITQKKPIKKGKEGGKRKEKATSSQVLGDERMQVEGFNSDASVSNLTVEVKNGTNMSNPVVEEVEEANNRTKEKLDKTPMIKLDHGEVQGSVGNRTTKASVKKISKEKVAQTLDEEEKDEKASNATIANVQVNKTEEMSSLDSRNVTNHNQTEGENVSKETKEVQSSKTGKEYKIPELEAQTPKVEEKDPEEKAIKEEGESSSSSVVAQNIDDDYDYNLMEDFTDLPSKLQDTAQKVADHLGPNIQKLTNTSKTYFHKANQHITDSFSPLVGKNIAPFFASLISYGMLLLPLVAVVLLFEHIRTLVSLPRVMFFVNVYLAAYFATLLLATSILGEPMTFFFRSSPSGYIHLQLIEALGYIVYLVLHTCDLVSACSSDSPSLKVAVVIQWCMAFMIGLHYYVTVFHRAMALRAPHTSWKIYGIYSISFFLLCLFARIRRTKKGYSQLGDMNTNKKS